jgi:molecular chaperone GrpE
MGKKRLANESTATEGAAAQHEGTRPTPPEAGGADETEAPPGAGPQAVPALEAPTVEQLVGEIEELRDRYLRVAAEYDNFRKRTGRERLELKARAQAELVLLLLEGLDDLGRVAHLDPTTTPGSDVIAGVELVERKLLRALTGAGLERIAETDVAFDPNQHEAMGAVPADGPDQDHTVAAVFQVGYRFGGQLLRPARVQVRLWSGDAGA